MPKPRATASATSIAKVLRSNTRTTGKKTTCAPSAQTPSEPFDPAAHYAAIAELAYRNWQARGNAPGSAQDDWLRAENELRANWPA